MADLLQVSYRLARTVATISGTVTVPFGENGQRLAAERTSAVSLGVEGDPAGSLILDLKHHHKLPPGAQEFDLHLGADGRLTGAGYESAGAGSQVIGALFHIASLAGAAALTAAEAIREEPELSALPADVRAKLALLKSRRDELAKLVDSLQAGLIAAGTAAAGVSSHDQALFDRLKAIESALTSARVELTDVEQALKAAHAMYLPSETTSYTYVIGVDEMPARDRAEDSIELTVSELPAELQQAACKLETLVVRIEPSGSPVSVPAEPEEAIVYRLPRRVQLAVYEVPPSPGSADGPLAPDAKVVFRLRQVLPVWVVDSRSAFGVLPVTHDVFTKHAATLEFGEAGTLTHLTNKQGSAVGDIATALGAAGGQITEGVEQAGKIRAALPAKQDPALVALQAELARKQLEANLVTANDTISKGKQP